MEVSLNGLPVTRCTILAPRIGAWTADVAVDTETDIAGAVSVVVDGVTLRGAVARGGVAYGRWSGRIVGGAGGLSRPVAPVAQYATTLAVALADVLREAGETLAATSGDLSTNVTRWHRAAGTAANAVADVARAAGYAWRVLSDGTVWMGAETWPAATVTGVELLDWRPELGRAEFGGDAAALLGILPGQTITLDGITLRAGCIEHRIDAGEIRTVVFAEPAATSSGRFVDALARLVASLTRRLDYLGAYPATVVQQHADGTVDLRPDDATHLASCTRVPLRHGLPGVTAVSVADGTRVRLAFDAGDPAQPYAALWDAGNVTSLTFNGSARRIARTNDTSACGYLIVVAGAVSSYVPPGTPLPDPLPPGGTAIALSGVITGTSDLRG